MWYNLVFPHEKGKVHQNWDLLGKRKKKKGFESKPNVSNFTCRYLASKNSQDRCIQIFMQEA